MQDALCCYVAKTQYNRHRKEPCEDAEHKRRMPSSISDEKEPKVKDAPLTTERVVLREAKVTDARRNETARMCEVKDD
ncbi:hypothetical protein NDU88_002981 [Pleurodeles waltl]|uniref:Uncharacterized protein n=1 Tax=Pleurodeles waltl TaxID=8319 RepID=A0AAV7UX66_PLEWA|nr:hypothetical protein NDU88_002981 [Pleurodeles waltl]